MILITTFSLRLKWNEHHQPAQPARHNIRRETTTVFFIGSMVSWYEVEWENEDVQNAEELNCKMRRNIIPFFEYFHFSLFPFYIPKLKGGLCVEGRGCDLQLSHDHSHLNLQSPTITHSFDIGGSISDFSSLRLSSHVERVHIDSTRRSDSHHEDLASRRSGQQLTMQQCCGIPAWKTFRCKLWWKRPAKFWLSRVHGEHSASQ